MYMYAMQKHYTSHIYIYMMNKHYASIKARAGITIIHLLLQNTRHVFASSLPSRNWWRHHRPKSELPTHSFQPKNFSPTNIYKNCHHDIHPQNQLPPHVDCRKAQIPDMMYYIIQ